MDELGVTASVIPDCVSCFMSLTLFLCGGENKKQNKAKKQRKVLSSQVIIVTGNNEDDMVRRADPCLHRPRTVSGGSGRDVAAVPRRLRTAQWLKD